MKSEKNNNIDLGGNIMDDKSIIGVILTIVGIVIILAGMTTPITDNTCFITFGIGGILFVVGIKLLGMRFRKWGNE